MLYLIFHNNICKEINYWAHGLIVKQYKLFRCLERPTKLKVSKVFIEDMYRPLLVLYLMLVRVSLHMAHWSHSLEVIFIKYIIIVIILQIKFITIEKHGYENTVINLACGAVAGMAGQSSSYPLDIIRRKMQTSIITGKNYTNLRTTFMLIYK